MEMKLIMAVSGEYDDAVSHYISMLLLHFHIAVVLLRKKSCPLKSEKSSTFFEYMRRIAKGI